MKSRFLNSLFALVVAVALVAFTASAAPAAYEQSGPAGLVVLFFGISALCAVASAALKSTSQRGEPALFANSGITTLLPIVTQALDVVSREMVGFIPSVTRDAKADRLAKNQTLYSWQVPAATLSDVTPGAATPSAGDKTIASKSVSVTNFKMSDFYFTGEEEKQLGENYGNVVTDMVEQAVRAVVNQMEADIFSAAYVGASRAYGTAGTTPFASDVAGTAQLGKILDDNGAPGSSRSLIIDTSAGALLKTLAQLTKANEAGTTMTLRDGQLLDLNQFSIKQSAAVTNPAIGTGSGYLVNNGAGYAVGSTAITVDTGSGTILAGDIITIGSDTNKYVVASALAANVVTIAAPGLRVAAADNAAITVVSRSTRNIGFSRNAIVLATRLCAVPSRGDIASDRTVITDARSGISLELAEYPQYRQVRYEISAAWGVNVVKNEHIAALLG